MKNKITIHKQNELVRGADSYSLNAKKALNAIYWGLQKHNLYEYRYVDFTFVTLRKIMNLENNDDYVERIKEALRELMHTMELNNWTNPLDGKTSKWFATRFINEVHFSKNTDGEWVARIETNQTIKDLMQLDKNFTELDLLQYMNKFRTKYAMKIYEYLKSFGVYKYLDISQKHLMKLLGIDEDSKYKYYSQLETLVERQLQEIAKKSDLQEVKILKSKLLAQEKTFRIIINPKSKKSIDKIKAKTALDNLIKRF